MLKLSCYQFKICCYKMFNASPIASTKNIARTNTQKKLKKESRYVTIKKKINETQKKTVREEKRTKTPARQEQLTT